MPDSHVLGGNAIRLGFENPRLNISFRRDRRTVQNVREINQRITRQEIVVAGFCAHERNSRNIQPNTFYLLGSTAVTASLLRQRHARVAEWKTESRVFFSSFLAAAVPRRSMANVKFDKEKIRAWADRKTSRIAPVDRRGFSSRRLCMDTRA